MIPEKQGGRLVQLMETGKDLRVAALKTGMDETTARRYICCGKPFHELTRTHRVFYLQALAGKG
ncbi:MAG: hypothetical protein JXB42_09605 [Deltaproteobacteria bacterium]|nr:hypothetical protein [Deltaproteobacteria bacterium]